MVSHRWLSPNLNAGMAHPDDTENHKHDLLCFVFQLLGAEGWIRSTDMLDVVTWVDYGKFHVLVVPT